MHGRLTYLASLPSPPESPYGNSEACPCMALPIEQHRFPLGATAASASPSHQKATEGFGSYLLFPQTPDATRAAVMPATL